MSITLHNVTRINGNSGGSATVVLDDVSFAFEAGATTGVLALRGGGKSTLIKLMTGSVPPTRGQVVRSGLVSFPVGSFGWMHRYMTGRENLHFLARVYGVDHRPVVDFVAGVSGLGKALDDSVASYSGEKRARLSFSASYAMPFDVYLGDEFLIGGPPGFRDICRTMARERMAESTFILATRSPALVRLFCDRAVILSGGKLTGFDSVREALVQYAALTEAAAAEPAEQDSGFWAEDVEDAA